MSDKETKLITWSHRLFISAQCRFSYSVCSQIWPENTDHYWSKWIATENIILFINRLDTIQANKLYTWILSLS